MPETAGIKAPVAVPSKSGARCIQRKLDVKTGMVITRYGCERPRQGRWRDVGKTLGAATAN